MKVKRIGAVVVAVILGVGVSAIVIQQQNLGKERAARVQAEREAEIAENDRARAQARYEASAERLKAQAQQDQARKAEEARQIQSRMDANALETERSAAQRTELIRQKVVAVGQAIEQSGTGARLEWDPAWPSTVRVYVPNRLETYDAERLAKSLGDRIAPGVTVRVYDDVGVERAKYTLW